MTQDEMEGKSEIGTSGDTYYRDLYIDVLRYKSTKPVEHKNLNTILASLRKMSNQEDEMTIEDTGELSR